MKLKKFIENLFLVAFCLLNIYGWMWHCVYIYFAFFFGGGKITIDYITKKGEILFEMFLMTFFLIFSIIGTILILRKVIHGV